MKNLLQQLNELSEKIDLDQFNSIELSKTWDEIIIMGYFNNDLADELTEKFGKPKEDKGFTYFWMDWKKDNVKFSLKVKE